MVFRHNVAVLAKGITHFFFFLIVVVMLIATVAAQFLLNHSGDTTQKSYCSALLSFLSTIVMA